MEFCTLSEYTDDEVKEMFRRQNSGKPLGGKLLRIVNESDKFSDAVYSLANHPFIDKLVTKAQRKNGTDRDLIIQTLMLIETTDDKEFVSFRTKDIDTFVTDHADSITQDKFDMMKTVLDSFDETFEEIKIPVTSAPMMLYAGYVTKKGKKSFSKFVTAINDFLLAYDNNEDYKQYVLSGTSSSENVRGRLNYWKGIIKSF